MNRFDSDRDNNEAVIDQFIDDLNEEKRPTAYQAGPVDLEMEKLFETVRAVRRLEQGSFGKEKVYKRPRLKGWLAVAAAVLLVVLGLSILQFPGLDLALPGIHPGGIVEASTRAYEELRSYSGVFEIRNERDGMVDSLETITVQYQKPNKYFAVHRFNGLEQRYVSDGEKMIADEDGRVTVENLFPEKELWRYHIGTVIRELGQAETVETLGSDTLFGREAELLRYQYPNSGPDEYMQIWIDTATYLPLRKELFHPDGSVLVVEFKELEVNPQFDSDAFSWILPEGKEVTELNRTGTLEQVKKAWPEVEAILPTVYAEMELQRVGLLNDDLFDYVLRFKDESTYDFLDIYYTDVPQEFNFYRQGKFGLLGEGYVELNPSAWNVFELYLGPSRTARWITLDYEVYMVTSRSVDYLQSLLEELAQETVQFKTAEEMIERGLEPVTEKEGH